MLIGHKGHWIIRPIMLRSYYAYGYTTADPTGLFEDIQLFHVSLLLDMLGKGRHLCWKYCMQL